jgi:hypothetical protein
VNKCIFVNEAFFNTVYCAERKEMFRPKIYVPRVERIAIDVHAAAEEPLQYST